MSHKTKALVRIVALTSAFSVILAPAAGSAWDNGGVSGVKIKSITTLQDSKFYLKADKDLCDPETNKIGTVYIESTTNGNVQWSPEGARMMLSTAIAAHLAGKTVKIYADDSGSGWGCRMGAIKIE